MADVARTYVGTPFVHAGREPGKGMDCAGVVIAAARAVGLLSWDNRNYQLEPDPAAICAALEEHCERVPPLEWLEPGDVFLFAICGHPHHLGMLSLLPESGTFGAPGYFVHAYQSCDLVTETALDDPWKRRVRAVYRWRQP